MVALRDRRPFSLDRKLPNLDSLLPGAARPAEIRLLCVRPEHRRGRVLPGLLHLLAEHCSLHGHDLLLASAFVPRLRFYERLGFDAFGPRVGSQAALFQPMMLRPSSFQSASSRLSRLCGRRDEEARP